MLEVNITHLIHISLKNKKAQQLIDKILADLSRSGIITNTVTEDLLAVRSYALEEQIPLAVKVLRLTCEHINKTDTFSITIPDDEPIEDENVDQVDVVVESITDNPVESLSYMIALIKDLDNKTNVADLKEYRDALIAF